MILTFEKLQNAIHKALQPRPYQPPIISYRAKLILDKIHKVEPTFRVLYGDWEIYFKANELEIK